MVRRPSHSRTWTFHRSERRW
ncbi:hypothetical protein LINPERPRIM_LOCUS40460 [Linum perenne]